MDEKLTGVLVDTDIDSDIPLCVYVSAGGVPLGAGDLLTFGSRPLFSSATENMLVSLVSRQFGLAFADDGELGGVLGALGPLAGAKTVDAFTNPDFATLRTGDARLTRFFFVEEPQWVLLEDGVTLSVRRTSPAIGPFPIFAEHAR